MNEFTGDTQLNIIAAGTSIEGNIVTKTSCRIDGTVRGKLVCAAKVIIGTTGSLDGEIQCDNIEIEGNVKANIVAKDIISLRATAVLNGNIISSKLAIEPGANFNGNCRIQEGAASMPAPQPEAKNDKK